jgi:hypothetical protein
VKHILFKHGSRIKFVYEYFAKTEERKYWTKTVSSPHMGKKFTKKMSVCLPCNVSTELERFKTVKGRAKKYSRVTIVRHTALKFSTVWLALATIFAQLLTFFRSL